MNFTLKTSSRLQILQKASFMILRCLRLKRMMFNDKKNVENQVTAAWGSLRSLNYVCFLQPNNLAKQKEISSEYITCYVRYVVFLTGTGFIYAIEGKGESKSEFVMKTQTFWIDRHALVTFRYYMAGEMGRLQMCDHRAQWCFSSIFLVLSNRFAENSKRISFHNGRMKENQDFRKER